MSSTIDLDARVREMIFANMRYNDRLTARLVCRLWNEEILSLFSFKVILDDRSLQFDRIRMFPIYSCTIKNLTMMDWNLHFLQFPVILNALVISGPISMSNFESFLDGQHRLENLQTLVIHTNRIEEENHSLEHRKIRRISSKFGFAIPFSKLRSLSLRGPTESTLQNRIFNLFLLSRFQHLREFEMINWDCPTDSENGEADCIVRIFRFMARHSGTLRSLWITMTEHPQLEPEEWNGTPLSIGLKHIERIPDSLLQDLQLKRFFLSPLATGVGNREWAALLYKQKKLKYLNSHFHVCPFHFYKPVLVRNCQTLKELVLFNLTCWDCDTSKTGAPFRPINLDPFRFCAVLETLVISRYEFDRAVHRRYSLQPPPHFPDITNIHKLPSSLKTLRIRNFRVLCEEIYNIGGMLTNLRNLEFEDAGIEGKFGVTGNVLKHLLSNLSELNRIAIWGLNRVEGDDVLYQVIASVEKRSSTKIGASIEKGILEWDFNSLSPNPFARF